MLQERTKLEEENVELNHKACFDELLIEGNVKDVGKKKNV